MLANVLKSEEAVKMSVKVIEVFVKLREMVMDTTKLQLEIADIRAIVETQQKGAEIIFSYLNELSERVDEVEKRQNQNDRKRIGLKKEE